MPRTPRLALGCQEENDTLKNLKLAVKILIKV